MQKELVIGQLFVFYVAEIRNLTITIYSPIISHQM